MSWSAPKVVASVFNVPVAPADADVQAVYNTSTGNYLVLDSGSKDLYSLLQAGELTSAEAGIFYDAGFAVDPDVDEVAAVEQAFTISRAQRYTPHLTIAPTMDCNFGCSYCFESHIKGTMTVATQDRLLAFADLLLRSSGEPRALSITWFGGEPLMGLPAIQRLSRHFLEWRDAGAIRSYKAMVITNGYGLTERTCALLEECAVSHVQITLDGPARVHDARRFLKKNGRATFSRIVSNIHNLPPSMSVLVRMNVDRDNQDSYAELFEDLDTARLLDRVEVDLAHVENFSDKPTASGVLSTREFAHFKAAAMKACSRRRWPLVTAAPSPSIAGVCQVDSLNAFVVSARGELYKCWAELGNDGYRVGHLDEPAGWTRVAKTPLTERDPLDDPECRACVLLPTCMGGCPKVRDLNRTYHGKQCPPFKYMFSDLVYRQYGATSTIRKMLHSSSHSPSDEI